MSVKQVILTREGSLILTSEGSQSFQVKLVTQSHSNK